MAAPPAVGLRWVGRALALGGLATALVAGAGAVGRTPLLDPDDVCVVHGYCDPAANAAALARLWGWVGLGAGVLVLGLALGVVARPAVAPRPGAPGTGRSHAALLGGVVAGATAALGGVVLVLLVLLSTQLAAAGVLVLWVAQGSAVGGVLGTRAPHVGPRRARVAALLGAGGGLAVTGLLGAVLLDPVLLPGGTAAGALGAAALLVLDSVTVALLVAGLTRARPATGVAGGVPVRASSR